MTETTPYQSAWIQLAKRLDLSVRLSHEVEIASGKVRFPALLEGYGTAKGMLLTPESLCDLESIDQLFALGYGYSCVEIGSFEESDLPSILDMLEDWGKVV